MFNKIENYPRPSLFRNSYLSLDGEWDFTFDETPFEWPSRIPYEKGFSDKKKIIVPFAYQTPASNIGDETHHNLVWYSRHFDIEKKKNKRYIIHFEGADYNLRLFINSKYVGCDSGAYHRMSFDITDYINQGVNLIVVSCQDDYSIEKPRGKQRWVDKSFECFYVDNTGIYKPVWIEEVPDNYISNIKVVTDCDLNEAVFYLCFNKEIIDDEIKVNVYFDDKIVSTSAFKISGDNTSFNIQIDHPYLWNLNEGNLYFAKIALGSGDEITTYFAFRKIFAKDGSIYINDKELYQKLVLNQCYYPKGYLTPTDISIFKEDILKIKELGFNGCRIHQKMEDERFLFAADKLGFIVWCEMPSMYANTPNSRLIFEREWLLSVKQYFSHPSIITWVPFNESWGARFLFDNKEEQEFVKHIYLITKEFDPSRFVIANDGWEHTYTDIVSFHHYEQIGEKLHSYLCDIKKYNDERIENHDKSAFAKGYRYNGQPIIITEFGGTAFKDENSENWGYGVSKDKNEYLKTFEALISGLSSIPFIKGYCYTQYADVFQEINGFVDFNHNFKIDPKTIKSIVDKE